MPCHNFIGAKYAIIAYIACGCGANTQQNGNILESSRLGLNVAQTTKRVLTRGIYWVTANTDTYLSHPNRLEVIDTEVRMRGELSLPEYQFPGVEVAGFVSYRARLKYAGVPDDLYITRTYIQSRPVGSPVSDIIQFKVNGTHSSKFLNCTVAPPDHRKAMPHMIDYGYYSSDILDSKNGSSRSKDNELVREVDAYQWLLVDIPVHKRKIELAGIVARPGAEIIGASIVQGGQACRVAVAWTPNTLSREKSRWSITIPSNKGLIAVSSNHASPNVRTVTGTYRSIIKSSK